MKAKFNIIECTDNLVLIRDDARLYDCMSVTNDAEAVVEFLHSHRILKNKVLYYIDTDDIVDVLEHDNNGNFTGFKRGYSDLEDFYKHFELIK